jgi:energy-coupling factor transport system permease protein
MNPRALLLWVVAVLLLSLGTEDPVYRLVSLAAALAVGVVRRQPGTRLRGLLTWVGLACLFGVLLNFLLSHTGQDVIWQLPAWIPAVGGTLTLEAGAYGLDIALGLGSCLLAGSALALATDPYELVESLPQFLHRTAAALGSALTLVPRLGVSFTAVREAQAMRGWKPRGPRSWRAVAVPAVLTAIEGSVLLAEAMEARGFGSGPRTRSSTQAWRARDLAVAVAAGAAIAIFAAALLLGRASGWQPYPTLELPGVNWLPLLACLLLLTPAVAG